MTVPVASLVIRPPGKWTAVRLREVWEFRELLWRFAARDITLRYRQTVLGVIWVVLQPLTAAAVFAFVFGRVARLPSDGVPYFIFSYTGMLSWNLIAGTITKFSSSLVGNSGLISKIFFPRLLLPFSTWGSTLLDFGITLTLLVVLLLQAGVAPGAGLALLPVWILLALCLGAGIGLTAAALMVKYRDVGYVLPVAIQILLYATPIAYSLTQVPTASQIWVKLNPLTGVIVGFRWSLLNTSRPDLVMVAWSCVSAAALATLGIIVFSRLERQFADVI